MKLIAGCLLGSMAVSLAFSPMWLSAGLVVALTMAATEAWDEAELGLGDTRSLRELPTTTYRVKQQDAGKVSAWFGRDFAQKRGGFPSRQKVLPDNLAPGRALRGA